MTTLSSTSNTSSTSGTDSQPSKSSKASKRTKNTKSTKNTTGPIVGVDGRPRCTWPGDDSLYLAYHDDEWGRPEYDDRKLFEMLCLEGMQAGLSWITVLRKRESLCKAFADFDPEALVHFDDAKLAALKQDASIIRNTRKIASVVANAKAMLALKESGQSFSDYLWQAVDGEPKINSWRYTEEVPSSTDESAALSKRLKQDGFKFVGETIAYAFMQATGMVNDHLVSCFRHPYYDGDKSWEGDKPEA